MTYQEHGMWEVLDVLSRVHRGEGVRAMARSTGRARATVRRYVEAARELGWVPGVHEPDEELACAVAAQLRPGPSAATQSATDRLLQPHRPQLERWLDSDNEHRRGLTLAKVHLLLARQGVAVSYSALHRHAVKHLGFGQGQSTVRMADVAPGELAEVDFGKLGLVPDPATDKRRVLHALVVTLVHSRHQYVHVTHSQKLCDLIDGLEDAWLFFGGVPARVVVDNLKAAVAKADRYDPVFQRTFEEYARYRGFVVDAAVSASPTHKPHVERQVPYVRENFFRGESWLDRDHVQREAVRWCTSTAGLRVHGTTRKQPLVEFQAREQAALKPLGDKERFDTPRWATPSVHPDCHLRFDHALYSVPHRCIGKKVTLHADRALVRLYVGGALVKTHPRQPPGGRSTDHGDYPAHKTPYTLRDATYLIRQAEQRGVSVGLFARQLLDGEFPWAKLRQAQKLLRLCDKYGAERLDQACRRALAFELINVRRVERIVLQGLECPPPKSAPAPVTQLALRFLRPPDSFNHRPAVTRTVTTTTQET